MFDNFPVVLSSCIGRTLLIKFRVSFECFHENIRIFSERELLTCYGTWELCRLMLIQKRNCKCHFVFCGKDIYWKWASFCQSNTQKLAWNYVIKFCLAVDVSNPVDELLEAEAYLGPWRTSMMTLFCK